MSLRRIAFASSAGLLGLGLVGAPATVAWADSTSPASAPARSLEHPTVVPGPSGTFTVTLPGAGSLTFGVDATTGAVSNLMVAPAVGSPFSAGTPTATAEGVKVVFTSATTARVLEVEIENGATGPVVRAEVEFDDPTIGDDQHGSANSSSDGNSSNSSPGGPGPTMGTNGAGRSSSAGIGDDGTGDRNDAPGADDNAPTNTPPSSTPLSSEEGANPPVNPIPGQPTTPSNDDGGNHGSHDGGTSVGDGGGGSGGDGGGGSGGDGGGGSGRRSLTPMSR